MSAAVMTAVIVAGRIVVAAATVVTAGRIVVAATTAAAIVVAGRIVIAAATATVVVAVVIIAIGRFGRERARNQHRAVLKNLHALAARIEVEIEVVRLRRIAELDFAFGAAFHRHDVDRAAFGAATFKV